MGALPFHSACDGLPELPAWAWEKYITSPPSDAPNMLLLAAPPTDGKFAMEKWLQRLDSTLPYSQKVGGITAGDTRLFVGEKEHDGVEYSLRALPLGGFVGFPADDPYKPYRDDDPDLLTNRPVLDRVAVAPDGRGVVTPAPREKHKVDFDRAVFKADYF